MILVAVLCVIAYAPALRLPLISDDWLQIALARDYGPASGWSALAADPLYRCRATSLVLVSWIDRWFGATAIAISIKSSSSERNAAKSGRSTCWSGNTTASCRGFCHDSSVMPQRLRM